MDIESDFRRRKILKTSQGVFDLSQCRWRAINSALSKRKEITNPPSQGYIHAASVLKGSLYTIIGPDEQYPEQVHYAKLRACTLTTLRLMNGVIGAIAHFLMVEIRLDSPLIKVSSICSEAVV